MSRVFKPSVKLSDNDVTDESVYRQRRRVLQAMGFVGAGSLLAGKSHAFGWFDDDDEKTFKRRELKYTVSEQYATDEKQTPFDKEDHGQNAHAQRD